MWSADNIPRPIRTAALGAVALVIMGTLLHTLIPEPPIEAESYPAAGDVLVNPGAGERIVFRTVSDPPRDGATVIDVFLEPFGAVPLSHVHPDTEETFTVLEGQIRFVQDDQTDTLSAGDSVTVPPGVGHAMSNPDAKAAIVQVTMTPTRGMGLALTQVHGFLGQDPTPNPVEEFLQMLRFAERYDVYRADLPVWFQKLGIFMLAPTARLLGFRSFYPEYPEQAHDRNKNAK